MLHVSYISTKLEKKKTVKCNIAVRFLQEGGPLPGLENRFLSNIRKWIVKGDTRADTET